jgi:hypothetical protein
MSTALEGIKRARRRRQQPDKRACGREHAIIISDWRQMATISLACAAQKSQEPHHMLIPRKLIDCAATGWPQKKNWSGNQLQEVISHRMKSSQSAETPEFTFKGK